MPAATPVPLSEIVCGDPRALSLMRMLATRAPNAVGINAMEMVQLPDPAATLEQLFVCEKSAAFVPTILTELNVRAALPEFVIVMDCDELEVPTCCELNERELADAFI
jgi:hypothetical protein